ncbi:MAG: serine/threonine-protein kinase RsbW [Cyclobacteriaceae bacterium]|jgi:serine/threonine-protein kinase RsbW
MSESLDKYDIEELEKHKLILAIDEVCANLIIHANKCDERESLEIMLDVDPHSQVTFTIKDQGTGFDISQYQEPSISELISSKRKGGLGLMLVKRIMDQIEFSKEKNHNICRLIKTIK